MAKELSIGLQSADFSKNPSVIYRPLVEANHIRLLRILPATEPDLSDIISCQLSEESLDLVPPLKYRALSYVWGDAHNSKVILLDGQPFPIRNNLWTFLAQARREEFTEPLWIDAVCINQDDIDERSKQVAIMGRIYCRATDVRVWLENEYGKMEWAVEGIANFDWPLGKEKLDVGKERSKTALFWILVLFRSKYWTRLWVVQEFILAPCFAIQAGRHVIEEETMRRMENALISTLPFYDVDTTTPVSMLRARRSWLETEDIFFDSLLRFSTRQCTDPRDCVYALISLDRNASAKIVPDYSKTALQVFQEVIFLLSQDQGREGCMDPGMARFTADILQTRLGLANCPEATLARRCI